MNTPPPESKRHGEAVQSSQREPWFWKSLVQGIGFALVVAVASASLVPWIAQNVVSALREATCNDSRDLKRVVPVLVKSSSEHPPEDVKDGRHLEYTAEMVTDGDTGTAWVEGVEGFGQGEWIEFHFSEPQRLRLLCIANGYDLTWDLYRSNGRVRSFELLGADSKVLTTGSLADLASKDHFAYFQEVLLRHDMPPTDVLRLRITSVYASDGRERDSSTSLSEIEFWIK